MSAPCWRRIVYEPDGRVPPKSVVVYIGGKAASQSLCYLWLHLKLREKQQRVKKGRKNLNNRDYFRSG